MFPVLLLRLRLGGNFPLLSGPDLHSLIPLSSSSEQLWKQTHDHEENPNVGQVTSPVYESFVSDYEEPIMMIIIRDTS